MTDYDSPWKEALEAYFPEFMAFFFPRIHGEIVWERGHDFLDKELQQIVRDAERGRRLVDKLVRVIGQNGEEDWVLVHIEVQGQSEPAFAERMFIYHYRLFDRYRKPVVSLAILGDTQPAWRPIEFTYQRWDCGVNFRYPVIKLLDYRVQWDTLESSSNPFAVVVQAHLKAQETAGNDESRYRWKLELVKSLYRRGYSREAILALFRFIDWLLQLPEALEDRLWATIQAYEEQEKMTYITSVERLGIKKGIQQGLAAERQLLLRQVRRRFGEEVSTQSAPWLERITTPEGLEEIGEALLDCTTGEEWLRILAERSQG